VRTTGLLANNLSPIPLAEDVPLDLNRMFLPVDITLSIPFRNGLLPGGLLPRRR